MDAKLVAGYITSNSDFSQLPDVAAAAGLDSKDVGMVRYIASAALDDLKRAITADSLSESNKAVTKISEELSIGKDKVAGFVNEIRAELKLDCSDGSIINVNNIGNNTYLGIGGLLFKPSKEQTGLFDLVRYTGEGGDVVVPRRIRFTDLVYNVEEIEENTFRNTDVKTIVIPEGYVSVDAGAFEGCSKLESVSIPASLEKIGEGAFRKCGSLRRFDVAEGSESFWTDEYGILYTKDKRSLIHAPGALEGEVELPEELVFIRDSAFHGCSKVTKVTIGPNVKRIGKSVFSGCSSLEGIDLPASVTEVAEYAFRGCSSMRSICVDADNHVFASLGGILYKKDMKTLVRAPGSFEGDLEIPASVETISSGAFQECEKISTVRMGDSVKDVMNEAFKGCASLTSVTFGKNVENIGKYAFMGCQELDSVVLPDSVKSLGTWAFGECRSLRKASVPKDLDILMSAFPQETEIEKR